MIIFSPQTLSPSPAGPFTSIPSPLPTARKPGSGRSVSGPPYPNANFWSRFSMIHWSKIKFGILRLRDQISMKKFFVSLKAHTFMNNFRNKITVWVRLFPKIITLCSKIWPFKVSKAVELLTRGFQATSDF